MENAKTENDFFSHLLTALCGLLNEVLKEPSHSLFRRAPQVTLEHSEAGPGFQLSLRGKTIVDNDKSTFTAPHGDAFLVFRNPATMKTSFVLSGHGLTLEQRLKAHDRLSTFFFDNRTLAPFLPTSFEAHPLLAQKMRAHNAELSLAAMEEGEMETFRFHFDYTALYHSGNPTRADARVRQRNIDFTNTNERKEA